ncbi:MAG: hypothetical protein KKH25_06105, partial [Candidatus Omnitrophica bacterium]|nr:hypothetical protein [Candidatus Omnitrophota bacterium]
SPYWPTFLPAAFGAELSREPAEEEVKPKSAPSEAEIAELIKTAEAKQAEADKLFGELAKAKEALTQAELEAQTAAGLAKQAEADLGSLKSQETLKAEIKAARQQLKQAKEALDQANQELENFENRLAKVIPAEMYYHYHRGLFGRCRSCCGHYAVPEASADLEYKIEYRPVTTTRDCCCRGRIYRQTYTDYQPVLLAVNGDKVILEYRLEQRPITKTYRCYSCCGRRYYEREITSYQPHWVAVDKAETAGAEAKTAEAKKAVSDKQKKLRVLTAQLKEAEAAKTNFEQSADLVAKAKSSAEEVERKVNDLKEQAEAKQREVEEAARKAEAAKPTLNEPAKEPLDESQDLGQEKTTLAARISDLWGGISNKIGVIVLAAITVLGALYWMVRVSRSLKAEVEAEETAGEVDSEDKLQLNPELIRKMLKEKTEQAIEVQKAKLASENNLANAASPISEQIILKREDIISNEAFEELKGKAKIEISLPEGGLKVDRKKWLAAKETFEVLAGDNSLAANLAKLFFVARVLDSRSEVALMYNQVQSLKPSLYQFRQAVMTGINKDSRYPLLAYTNEFPRDPHVSMEGVFGQSDKQIAFAVVAKKSGFSEDEQVLAEKDALNPEHAGLTINDMEYAFAYANVLKTQKVMPAVYLEIDQMTPEIADSFSNLYEDFTAAYNLLVSRDLNSQAFSRLKIFLPIVLISGLAALATGSLWAFREGLTVAGFKAMVHTVLTIYPYWVIGSSILIVAMVTVLIQYSNVFKKPVVKTLTQTRAPPSASSVLETITLNRNRVIRQKAVIGQGVIAVISGKITVSFTNQEGKKQTEELEAGEVIVLTTSYEIRPAKDSVEKSQIDLVRGKVAEDVIDATLLISRYREGKDTKSLGDAGYILAKKQAPQLRIYRGSSSVKAVFNLQLNSLARDLGLNTEAVATQLISSLKPALLVIDIAEAGGRPTKQVVAELKAYDLLSQITADIKATEPKKAELKVEAEKLSEMIASIAKQQKVSFARMLAIFTNSLEPTVFIEGLSKPVSKPAKEVAGLVKNYPALALVATTYRIEHLSQAANGKTTTLKVEDIVSPEALSYMKDQAKIEIVLPEGGLEVDQGQYQVVKEHLDAVAEEAARKEHNHRGKVVDYFNQGFLPQEAAVYEQFVLKQFSQQGKTLKYILSSGIGANEMFSHLMAALHKAFSTSAIQWIVLDSPGQLRQIPADASDDNTLVIEFSRSGETQETLKILELTQNRFSKRLVYANKGPLKELALKLQQQGKPVVIRSLESRIGGRLMRRLTPMTYGPMYLAGMDTKAYAGYTDSYDQALDPKLKEKSLAVALARMFFILVVLGKRSEAALIYNQPQILEHSLTEIRQFIMEGANKKSQYPLIAHMNALPRDSEVLKEGVLPQSQNQIAFSVTTKAGENYASVYEDVEKT